jgi:valyl-tRNA synthetase
VTEEIYQGLFASSDGFQSIHNSSWPTANPDLLDERAEQVGITLVEVASSVRRYKSDHNLPLSSPIKLLQLATRVPSLDNLLQEAYADLMSITRAKCVEVVTQIDPSLDLIKSDGTVLAALIPYKE